MYYIDGNYGANGRGGDLSARVNAEISRTLCWRYRGFRGVFWEFEKQDPQKGFQTILISALVRFFKFNDRLMVFLRGGGVWWVDGFVFWRLFTGVLEFLG